MTSEQEILAGRLATIESEQATTSDLCKGLVKGQNAQGLLLERLVVTLENQDVLRGEQRDRCASHSNRLKDLEAVAFEVKHLPAEVASLRETVGKRGFLAAVFSVIATLSILAVKSLFTKGG